MGAAVGRHLAGARRARGRPTPGSRPRCSTASARSARAGLCGWCGPARADTRAELAGALVRHSGLGELQELIGSRFLSRADALRARSVLAGLDALMQATPPADDEHRLHYQLERVRAGAHELRELELLGVLRSGELHLPDEQRSGPNACSAPTVTTSAHAPRSRCGGDGRAGAVRGGRRGRPLAADRGLTR